MNKHIKATATVVFTLVAAMLTAIIIALYPILVVLVIFIVAIVGILYLLYMSALESFE